MHGDVVRPFGFGFMLSHHRLSPPPHASFTILRDGYKSSAATLTRPLAKLSCIYLPTHGFITPVSIEIDGRCQPVNIDVIPFCSSVPSSFANNIGRGRKLFSQSHICVGRNAYIFIKKTHDYFSYYLLIYSIDIVVRLSDARL